MFGSKRQLKDFTAEIEAHLDLEIARLRETGMNEQDARTAACRAFGNVTRAQERFFEAGRWLWWDRFCRDAHLSVRMMLRSPMISTVAVLTLTLGLGATTAIFSAVYTVLLKPLPFKDPERLVFIRQENPSRGFEGNSISPPQILAWRKDSGAFDDLAAYTQRSCVLTGIGPAEQDACEVVSSNLFPLLGAAPYRGRLFTEEEDRPDAPRVAILSFGFWQSRFGADENVIGRSVQLNGSGYTIVGVMPAKFSHQYASPYGSNPVLWLAGIGLSPEHVWNDYFGVGRLKPGIRLEQAARQMGQVSARLDAAYPDLKGWRAQLVFLRMRLARNTRSALVLLMGAVIFVLMISCANVANLMLARGSVRSREFAMRSALGASPRRIVHQLLTESLLISLAGGVLGIVLAIFGCRGLAGLAPAYVLESAPGLARGALDWRVFAFAFAAGLTTTLLVGLAPALQGARLSMTETLKDMGQRSSENPRSKRFRGVLIILEFALAMVLLVGAGLMVRTLLHLNQVNLGINPDHVLVLHVSLSGKHYEQPQARVEFWANVTSSIEALPGVEAASVSRGLPVGDWAGQSFVIPEQPNPPAGQTPSADYVIVSRDYFRTLRLPLLHGRGFSDQDTQSTEPVAIVNEELVRVYWPGQNPIGKKLRIGPSDSPWRSVLGVSGNVLTDGPDGGSTPRIYIPYRQFPWLLGGPQTLLVRTSSGVSPENMVRAVLQTIHHIDKDQPITEIATLEHVAREPMAQQRMVMVLLIAFAILALILSGLGIYSVFSYAISLRTLEIGIRIAVGATRGNVLRLILRGAAALALIGIAIGTGSALLLTHLMTHLLFGVSAIDPLTFSMVAVILLATSLFASYVPARRAMTKDPTAALRH